MTHSDLMEEGGRKGPGEEEGEGAGEREREREREREKEGERDREASIKLNDKQLKTNFCHGSHTHCIPHCV